MVRAYETDGWIFVRFPYRADLVRQIKENIFAGDRTWNKERREWGFDSIIWPYAYDLISDEFGEFTVSTKRSTDTGQTPELRRAYAEIEQLKYDIETLQQRLTARAGSTDGAHTVLCVTANAPREVIDAAYRALSKLHHPDVGGSTRLMQQINNAYDVVRGQK